MAEIKITGLEEVMAKLDDFTDNVARRKIRKALGAGANVLVEAAKGYAPVLAEATAERQPGELRDSIDKFPYRAGDLIGYRVGPGRDKGKGSESPGTYGMFVEFSIGHSAERGKAFLRPAFDSKGEEAVETVADTLRELVGL